MSGCAFDLVSVRQEPTAFTAGANLAKPFVLLEPVKASLGTTYPTYLESGTKWTCVGTVPEGVVFRTRDQIVKVEASNIQEAWIVVRDGKLVGFYMPVESTFAPMRDTQTLYVQPSS